MGPRLRALCVTPWCGTRCPERPLPRGSRDRPSCEVTRADLVPVDRRRISPGRSEASPGSGRTRRDPGSRRRQGLRRDAVTCVDGSACLARRVGGGARRSAREGRSPRPDPRLSLRADTAPARSPGARGRARRARKGSSRRKPRPREMDLRHEPSEQAVRPGSNARTAPSRSPRRSRNRPAETSTARRDPRIARTRSAEAAFTGAAEGTNPMRTHFVSRRARVRDAPRPPDGARGATPPGGTQACELGVDRDGRSPPSESLRPRSQEPQPREQRSRGDDQGNPRDLQSPGPAADALLQPEGGHAGARHLGQGPARST